MGCRALDGRDLVQDRPEHPAHDRHARDLDDLLDLPDARVISSVTTATASGGLGALLDILVQPVIFFTIPYEIANMYQRDGRKSPVSVWWGLWFLLPVIGHFVWYLKVQPALNDFWESRASPRTA